MLTFCSFAVYQKGDNSQYSNYQVISLLSAAYKFLPNIVLYNVTAYVEKIIGNCQFGFRCIDHDGSHIVYWSDCGGRIVRGREVQTARNVKGEGSADCKKCKGREVQTARNTTIRLGRSFHLISQPVWKPH